jgi:hypothetical protein
VAVQPPAEQDAQYIAIPNTGLNLPQRLPFEKWLHIGRLLSSVHTSSAWCLGDWLVYGESAYSGRYRDAIELCSLNYQTLRNYAWIARRFSRSRRWATLSFGHHAEVASLPDPEQDYWLRKADDLGWSRNRLRSEVRASISERATTTDRQLPASDEQGSVVGGRVELQLEPATDQFQLWHAAAAKARLSVAEWAVRQLDDAAAEMA